MTAINTAINVISKPKLNKTYKNELLATNDDHFILNQAADLFSDGDLYEIDLMYSNLTDGDLYVLGYSLGSNNNYIIVRDVNIQVRTSTGQTVFLGIGVDFSTKRKLTITRTATGIDFDIDTVSIGAVALSSDIYFDQVNRNGAVGGNSKDITLYDSTIKGRVVNWNEGNGADFYYDDNGDLAGTRNTIHLNGLNYINIEMIKPE